MTSDWLTIDLADPVWIVLAYCAGLAAKAVRLPPLVGYLATGFALHLMGARAGDFLHQIAELGIMLLLFTIGLKIDLRTLVRPEVWAVGAVSMAVTTALLAGVFLAAAPFALTAFAGLQAQQAVLLGFAFSFSSTVFAIKVLADRGALTTRHGGVAVGVLVLQDLMAVAFLAASEARPPSAWVLLLLALIPARPLLRWLLKHSGHGELLMLFGFTATLSGAALFSAAGLNGDLGALAAGVLLAGGGKADELNKALLGVKDLFLVGFFLAIGMTDIPDAAGLAAAALVLVLLPLRALGFFLLFSWRRLRARTSWQAALDLTSHSEFGLIVTSVAAEMGWLSGQWPAITAVTVAASFAVSAPFAERGDSWFTRHRDLLRRFERVGRLPGDEDLHIRPVDAIVFGLGRMGSRAFDALSADFGGRVLGVDVDPIVVTRNAREGRRAVLGDATDPDFWSRAHRAVDGLEWVLLTMSSHEANVAAVERLRERGFRGRIAATSVFPDHAEQLRRLGVDFAFDVYAEAGSGFANDVRGRIRDDSD